MELLPISIPIESGHCPRVLSRYLACRNRGKHYPPPFCGSLCGFPDWNESSASACGKDGSEGNNGSGLKMAMWML